MAHFWILLLISLFGPAHPQPPPVTVAVCEASAVPGGTPTYIAEGRVIRLLAVEGSPLPPSCASQSVPFSADAIRWMNLVPFVEESERVTQISLQGSFESQVRVTEVGYGAEPPPSPPLLPFQTEVLRDFTIRPFGVEERVQVLGERHIVCAAGQRPAGVVLRPSAIWDGIGLQSIDLAARGDGSFSIAIADSARDVRESPLLLDSLAFRRGDPGSRHRLDLPNERGPWTNLTIVCPEGAAELHLEGLTIVPQESFPAAMRSAWLWSPDLWLEVPERVWEIAEQRKIDRLFLTIPVGPGGVENADDLQVFIAEATRRRIGIWAVIGDPRDVFESSIVALRARTDAYIHYNASAPEGAAISGLQLDIEPYLLPGFSLAQDYWRERYLSTVLSIHGRISGRFALDLVVPVWWGDHPNWGGALLDGLVAPDLSLTIMNYRTAPGSLGVGARPFLAWGRDSGVPISIALEVGSIGPDEVRRSYERVEDGPADLLLLEVGEHRVLLLVDGAHSRDGAQAYRMIRERPAPASAVTFAGDLDRLEDTAVQMETAWKAWSSYAGLAIHGLDELYSDERNPR